MLLGTQSITEGRFSIGGCDAQELAREFGTPLYVYDEEGLRQTCLRYRESLGRFWPRAEVAYACKAFAVGAMIRLAESENLGFDVISEGELVLALESGADPAGISLHGNYKSTSQIELAVRRGVGRIVIDSLDEIEPIADAASAASRRQSVLLRVNPEVGGVTDKRYETGSVDSKFGLALRDGSARAALERASAAPSLAVDGIHFHLGSQIGALAPFAAAMANTAEFIRTEAGGWTPKRVVLGGGMAARYSPTDVFPSPEKWAAELSTAFRSELAALCREDVTLAIEPGRSIAAENGVTLYTVGPIKAVHGANKKIDAFVTVDGGISDNPRPLMYSAHHEVLHASAADAPPEWVVEVCGHHCETDTLSPAAALPSVVPGDVLVVQTTGAYTHSMASNYNGFTRPAVVFAGNGRARIVRRRETLDDLMCAESEGPGVAEGASRAVRAG